MECRFVFTPQEIRSAVRTYRRLNLIRGLITFGLMWLVFLFLFAFNLWSDLQRASSDEPITSSFGPICGDAAILMIPFLVTCFYFLPFGDFFTSYLFRRNPLYNQNVLYKLEESGFTLQSQVMSQSASWSAIGRAGESARGFILFWGKSKKSFHWLPKHGFSSESEILACRSLIQNNIRNFKQVG